jgi:formylglycine-generating enzyme required for sulfatase activity
MKKFAYLLMGCALLLSMAQTSLAQTATADLTFNQLKSVYNVGECIIVNLQEDLEASSRFHRVDLWVAIEPPSQEWLFMTALAFDPFSAIGQPFRTSLDSTKKVHRILDFEVLPGLGGDYTFYAVYVVEGKNPLTDGFMVFRSNVAIAATTLSNRALPTDAPSNCDIPHVDPEPTPDPDVPTGSPPAAPTHLAAVAGNSQITLTWQPVAGAASYTLHWREPDGTERTLSISAESYRHSGLSNGASYTYWVTAVNAGGLESTPSATVVATPQAPESPPATPTNLSAVAGNSQITLTWQPVAGAASYAIYMREAGSTESRVSVTATSYAHTGLHNGTSYAYRVTAVSASGLESTSSATVAAIPQAPAPQPGDVFRDSLRDGGSGPEMVVIPAGSFRMGDIQGEGSSDEQPVHSVSVNSFAIGRYEVTVGEFRRFVEITGYQTEAEKGDGCYVFQGGSWTKENDANWRNPYFSQTNNHPVVCVSWNDATDYAAWLTQQTGHQYRLPTEAEWEYSARAGTETSRHWGNNPDDACGYANVHDNTSKEVNGFSWTHHNCTDGYAQTAPVGHFQPNGFGLFDVLGNTWEWTCSEYESPYKGAEQGCVDKSEGGYRVLRGGSWALNPSYLRSAFRDWLTPDYRLQVIGFRVVGVARVH